MRGKIEKFLGNSFWILIFRIFDLAKAQRSAKLAKFLFVGFFFAISELSGGFEGYRKDGGQKLGGLASLRALARKERTIPRILDLAKAQRSAKRAKFMFVGFSFFSLLSLSCPGS